MTIWMNCGKSITGSDDTVYAIAANSDGATVVELPNNAVLVVKQAGIIVDFAAFELAYGEGAEARYTMLVHGSGPSGELRELRHTYWGDDGYVFYPSFEIIEAIMRELRRYFDA